MFKEDFSPAEDRQTDLEKLEKYSGDVDWNYLRPHFENGAMLYVDPSLELKDVGLALTKDNKARIEAWLKAGDLVQPCDLHAKHWKESNTHFHAMIVRPFVLAQPL